MPDTYRGFEIEEEQLARDHGPLRAGTLAFRVTNPRDGSLVGIYDSLPMAKFCVDLRLSKEKPASTGTLEDLLAAIAELTQAVTMWKARGDSTEADAAWRKEAIATVSRLREEAAKRAAR